VTASPSESTNRARQEAATIWVPPFRWMRFVRVDRSSLVQAVRTTVAAIVSAALARACGLPEPFWAVIATIIVMQSSLGTAWRVSRERMLGTAIGASTGAVLLSVFPQSIAVFALGMLLMAGVCAVLRQSQSAYRFAGITLVIMLFPTYSNPPWIICVHRTLETFTGIVVGMIVMAFSRKADQPTAGPDLPRP
jgi:uncharacterized membrane protein YgaE (UPF0421/DUF939 family)